MVMREFKMFLPLFLLLSVVGISGEEPETVLPLSTFSIVGYDPLTGDLGVAVASRFLAVGSVVPYARANVGAIATQAFGNTTYGPRGLDLLSRGHTPGEVITLLTKKDKKKDQRQVGIVDARGNAATYTGKGAITWAGGRTGKHYAVQGNILTGEEVIQAMATAYERTGGGLAEKLLSALEAGEQAGGDKRGKQSAALLVVREHGGYAGYNDRFIDLRVDDHSNPIAELRRLYNLWNNTFGIGARLETASQWKKQGKIQAAEAEMKRAFQTLLILTEVTPNDPQVLNAAAWYMCLHDFELPKALELAKKAASLSPQDSAILDTLAECYFHNGEFQKAVETEEKALALSPGNTAIQKSLQRYKDALKKQK